MCGGHNLLRNILHQIFLGSQRCGAGLRNQSDAVAHAEHMCIYCHGRFVEYYTLNDISRLASHSRQFNQFLLRFPAIRFLLHSFRLTCRQIVLQYKYCLHFLKLQRNLVFVQTREAYVDQ